MAARMRPVGVEAKAVAKGIGQAAGPLVQGVGVLTELFGVVVGPGDVRAGADAAVQAGAGDAKAVVQVLPQVGDGVDGGAGGLDVEELVDAVTAAGGISARDGGAEMAVLNGQGHQPSGRRAMCQARVRRKRSVPIAPCGSGGMTSWARPSAVASLCAHATKSSMRSTRVATRSEPLPFCLLPLPQ
ncbi:hypothetical protein [Streptomyces radicis]|uniref:Uncharacterized protein n=1 Tax=Streptomyces radicis TaxID=1750517 RepID=A0A3A9VWM5_9ACTN|nr:hypothetical protein [Streptomyces radicis]RKN05338.1 hypothetical protein D7319_25300 [Streptomyces radicis]RKN16845.1 hypothetical protein D7318_24665 [Streptomyces radicis]